MGYGDSNQRLFERAGRKRDSRFGGPHFSERLVVKGNDFLGAALGIYGLEHLRGSFPPCLFDVRIFCFEIRPSWFTQLEPITWNALSRLAPAGSCMAASTAAVGSVIVH